MPAAGGGLESLGEEETVAFARRLAATEKSTRDLQIKALRTYLAKKQKLGDTDMLKIWKALFYCMWLCDKVPIQQELTQSLAGLIECFEGKNAVPRATLFMEAFWRTMGREWPLLDKHRLDKFYSLVRGVVNAMLAFVKKESYSQTALETLYGAMDRLLLREKKVNGLRLHLCDLILDEIVVVDPNISTATLLELLGPFLYIMSKGDDRAVQERAQTAVGLGLVKKVQDGLMKEVDLAEVQGVVFELAASNETYENHRDSLYALYKAMKRATGTGTVGKKRKEEEGAEEKKVEMSGEGVKKKQRKGVKEDAMDVVEEKKGVGKKQLTEVVGRKQEQGKGTEKKGVKRGIAAADKMGDAAVNEHAQGTAKGASLDKASKKRKEGSLEDKGGKSGSIPEKPKMSVGLELVNGLKAKKDQNGKIEEVVEAKKPAGKEKYIKKGKGARKETEEEEEVVDMEVDTRSKKKNEGQTAPEGKVPAKGKALEEAKVPQKAKDKEGGKGAVEVKGKKEAGKVKGVEPKEGKLPQDKKKAVTKEVPVKKAKKEEGAEIAKTAGKGKEDEKKETPEYIPSKGFAGAKSGYVFKKDRLGVGYYLDKQASKGNLSQKDQKRVRFGGVHVKVFKKDEGPRFGKQFKKPNSMGTINFDRSNGFKNKNNKNNKNMKGRKKGRF